MPSPEVKIKDNKYSIEFVSNNYEYLNEKKNSFDETEEKNIKLNELIKKANNEFGENNVNEIFDVYKKYQDNLTDENTKELDNFILNKMNNEQKKYDKFLELFYNIIYLKYLKKID